MNFLTVEQYQLIKAQAKKVLNANTMSKDQKVIQAVQSLVLEELQQKIQHISDEQINVLQPIFKLQSKEQLDSFLNEIKQYVIPFEKPTEQQIKKLFPKVKKLKIPALEQVDWKEIIFLSWFDSGTNRKYIVYRDETGVLKGMRGVFSHSEKDGICSICNQLSKVGMFMVSKSGTSMGTYTKKGNYICQDNNTCNTSLTDSSKLIEFIEKVQ